MTMRETSDTLPVLDCVNLLLWEGPARLAVADKHLLELAKQIPGQEARATELAISMFRCWDAAASNRRCFLGEAADDKWSAFLRGEVG